MGAVLFEANFKEGFIRHDGHVAIFFFLVLYATATLPRWNSVQLRGPAVGGLALAVLLFAAGTGYPLSTNLDPSPSASGFFSAVNQIVSADAWSASLRTAQANARDHYQVPQEVLDALYGHTVHVDPSDLTVAWAYDLNWLPPLTAQRYSDYTERIDSRTADRLRASDGPERILRSLDGPQTVAAYLCDYRPVVETDAWQVLTRTDHRCGDLQAVSTTSLAAGEELPVPELTSPDQALFIRIDFDLGIGQRAFATVYKGDIYRMYFDDVGYKVLPTTTTQPGPLYIPAASGWGEAFRGAVYPPEIIRLSHAATITFYTVTISA